jgi:CheY-like chemotaxis protein
MNRAREEVASLRSAVETERLVLKGSILIVDDQASDVLLLEKMLYGAGYLSVTSTTDPGEVCELYLKNAYSLILLDL